IGALQPQTFARDLEVRNLRAVLGCGFVLGDLQTSRVKKLRQAFELLALWLAQGSKVQARRGQKIGKVDEIIVGFIRINAVDACRAELRRGQLGARPVSLERSQGEKLAADVIQHIEQQMGFGGTDGLEAASLGWGEQAFKMA